MGKPRKDYTGIRHGKLVALELIDYEHYKLWKCQCDCGNTTNLLNFGQVKSCGCTSRRPPRPEMVVYEKVCPMCNVSFKTIHDNVKTCSTSCGSKMRFVTNPELYKRCSENGTRSFKRLRETNQAYIMPVGTHTEEFKKRLSERAKLPKSEETKEKIKQNHWSKNEEIRQQVIDKIGESRSTSEKWNSESRRYDLANRMAENPELTKSHPPFKVGNFFNKFIDADEYHHSGFELSFMKYLDTQLDIKYWTKKHKIVIEYELDGKNHKYYPDFYIEFLNGFKTIVELKGRVKDPFELEQKNTAAQKYCNDNNLVYQIIHQKYKNDFENIRNC